MLSHLIVKYVALAPAGIVRCTLMGAFLTRLAFMDVWLTGDFLATLSTHRRLLHCARRVQHTCHTGATN